MVNSLMGPVFVFSPQSSADHTFEMAKTHNSRVKLSHVTGRRHETVLQAYFAISMADLPVPTTALAVIRNPFDLMMSYYKHMQKPSVWKLRGMRSNSLDGAPKAAMELPFNEFVRKHKFYDMSDSQLAQYYAGGIFETLNIVPIENLAQALPVLLKDYIDITPPPLPFLNKSKKAIQDTSILKTAAERSYPFNTELHRKALENGMLSIKLV